MHVAKNNFAASAYDFGYADQSHMIKEIKYFTDITPKKLDQYFVNIENSVLVNLS